jgi:hypothetical protein
MDSGGLIFLCLSIGFIVGAIWASKDAIKPFVKIGDMITMKPKHKAVVPKKSESDHEFWD